MLKKYLTFCLLALVAIGMVACGGDAPTPDPKPEENTNTHANHESESTPSPEPADPTAELKTKLTGTWMANHDPDGLDLKADGTYEAYMPAGMAGPDSPKEVYESGTWSVEGEMMVMTPNGAGPQKSQVTWINDKVIFLGDLDAEFDESYGTKEDYAMEFGMSKK